jgi:hypothetical protein
MTASDPSRRAGPSSHQRPKINASAPIRRLKPALDRKFPQIAIDSSSQYRHLGRSQNRFLPGIAGFTRRRMGRRWLSALESLGAQRPGPTGSRRDHRRHRTVTRLFEADQALLHHLPAARGPRVLSESRLYGVVVPESRVLSLAPAAPARLGVQFVPMLPSNTHRGQPLTPGPVA